MSGRDVRQLERNLRDLGFDRDRAMPVDGRWDPGTTAAVKRWQHRKHRAQTGTIAYGQIVFLPGTRRVTDFEDLPLGSPIPTAPGQPTGGIFNLTSTSTHRVVSVQLPTSQSALAKPDTRVHITLPLGKNVAGTIRGVGKVAKQPEGSQSSTPTVAVAIALAAKDAAGELDKAPVSVRFERSRADDVLAVPVTALLAVQGGRYAVDVHEDGAVRTMRVEPGIFTGGFVQITGPGVEAGMTVSDGVV